MTTPFAHPDVFSRRHIGPSAAEQKEMLAALGVASLDQLIAETIPASIQLTAALDLPRPRSEAAVLAALEAIAAKNQLYRSYIGMGYVDTITPPVIRRNVLENPGWYTQYTPYQAEISQGRLEALLNYQQMVMDLTGLQVANASMLDEATAAAEAMGLIWAVADQPEGGTFFVDAGCHPQTIAVVRQRAEPLGIHVVVAEPKAFDWNQKAFGVLLQYPTSTGHVVDPRPVIERAHAEGARVAMAADILALCVLVPPGELGADVAVGSTQRFGVPLGYGGPHAAYFATKLEFVRKMPGRLIGVSVDAHGRTALRMALATREQHIRREKATSNICTAQVLLAVIASMYAVYHGPEGLTAIARRVHGHTAALKRGLERLGVKVVGGHFFDTLELAGSADEVAAWHAAADARKINLRPLGDRGVGITIDETTGPQELAALLSVFAGKKPAPSVDDLWAGEEGAWPAGLARKSSFLTHEVFHHHRSETEMLRYLKRLEGRDLSLTHSMIPLGSCTMKLNATVQMLPVTFPGFGRMHPFVPVAQAQGYAQLFGDLSAWLAEITGFPAVSLQPNAGSQGEYAGLLVIRRYHEARGEAHRDVCLIPSSAHGTNPASAAMVGLKVVVVACDAKGNVDLADLAAKAKEHAAKLSALMITYPSTHGVFEEDVKKICDVVHSHGGQVYMDGANMNAQVGLTRPAAIGADVCHLNLHKTFCIPHGGGGPGMGPIAVAAHLAKHLPTHPVVAGVGGGATGIGPISAAPWGSASILVIPWAYIAAMGADGLTDATKVAILGANYIAKKLAPHYPIVYTGVKGRVAHECIIDLRMFKKSCGIEVDDVAKRLMDYGFHAPTMSFPIASTMMIEPTESEDLAEIDRFCNAMISIREEIREVEEGKASREDNVLKHAPHTAEAVTADEWKHAYSRQRAAFPLPYVKISKFWPPVGRLNNTHGDRNFVCSCPPIEDYA